MNESHSSEFRRIGMRRLIPLLLILICALPLWMGADEPQPLKKALEGLALIQLLTYVFLLRISMKLGWIGGGVWLSSMNPEGIGQCKGALAQAPAKTFLLGLVVWLFLILFALFLLKNQLVALLIPIVAFVAYRFLFGVVAVYLRHGSRLIYNKSSSDSAPIWKKSLAGGLTIESLTLIPVFGWLVQICLNCQALGAVLLAGEFFRLRIQRVQYETPAVSKEET